MSEMCQMARGVGSGDRGRLASEEAKGQRARDSVRTAEKEGVRSGGRYGKVCS